MDLGTGSGYLAFPRREAAAYTNLLADTDQNILLGYEIEMKQDEIRITETVLNMIFTKSCGKTEFSVLTAASASAGTSSLICR